jgi:transposase-like protein
MMAQRRRHSADFKAKMAVEALKGQRTANEIAGEYGVHPTQLSEWKKQAIDGLPMVFSTQRSKRLQDSETLMQRLYQEIGQLKVELDWLKKKSGHR